MLLRLLQTEELDGLLLQVAAVLDGAQLGGEAFEASTHQWLRDVEKALLNNRLPMAGQVAAANATLAGSLHPPRQTGTVGQRPTRRDRAAKCVQTINQIVDQLSSELASTHDRISDAELVARRLLAVAKHKGLIATVDPHSPHRLQQLIEIMAADPDVSPGVVQLTALVGTQDCLIVLSRRLGDID